MFFVILLAYIFLLCNIIFWNSKKYPSNNGTEFTKRLLPKGGNTTTLLEEEPARLGIRHKLIRPYIPDIMARRNAATLPSRSYSLSLMCNTSLTNQQCPWGTFTLGFQQVVRFLRQAPQMVPSIEKRPADYGGASDSTTAAILLENRLPQNTEYTPRKLSVHRRKSTGTAPMFILTIVVRYLQKRTPVATGIFTLTRGPTIIKSKEG